MSVVPAPLYALLSNDGTEDMTKASLKVDGSSTEKVVYWSPGNGKSAVVHTLSIALTAGEPTQIADVAGVTTGLSIDVTTAPATVATDGDVLYTVASLLTTNAGLAASSESVAAFADLTADYNVYRIAINQRIGAGESLRIRCPEDLSGIGFGFARAHVSINDA